MVQTSAQPLDIAGMARRLKVHPNTVRLHLDYLVRTGRVERVETGSEGPGRPPPFASEPGRAWIPTGAGTIACWPRSS